MLSRVRDKDIRLVYLTILLLGVAYGLPIALIGNYLENRGFVKEEIGTLAIFFASGIMAASLPAGWLIRRVSAKKVLVAALLGYATTVAVFPYMSTYVGLGVVRFFDGAFSVGVWVSTETILLARAPRENKAFFTSIYALALALGYVIGSVLSSIIKPALGTLPVFVGAGVIALGAGAICAVALGKHAELVVQDVEAPAEEEVNEVGATYRASPMAAKVALTAGQIFWRIKTSCFATFAYGYFQASVVLFLPLYLKEHGMSEDRTTLMPAFFAGGMLLFANVAARLGDRFGHLAVMRVLGAVGTACIVSFLFVRHEFLVFGLIFLAGASLASVSPVSLALQGLVVPGKDLSRAGGIYNASYAIGMLVGPPIASQIYGKISGAAMLTHFAVMWGVFVVLTILFRADDPRVARAG